jgi:hypothetical protein
MPSDMSQGDNDPTRGFQADVLAVPERTVWRSSGTDDWMVAHELDPSHALLYGTAHFAIDFDEKGIQTRKVFQELDTDIPLTVRPFSTSWSTDGVSSDDDPTGPHPGRQLLSTSRSLRGGNLRGFRIQGMAGHLAEDGPAARARRPLHGRDLTRQAGPMRRNPRRHGPLHHSSDDRL